MNKNDTLRKADQTRKKLVDVSMKLFLNQGFEKTTMREIARAAGLAPGAAYYHFDSKEHLIFDFYEKSYTDHLPEAERVLKQEKALGKRLAGVIAAHLKVSEPYHEISKILFKTASDPSHPLSPFSQQSAELRQKNVDIMKRALEGERLDKDLAAKLPELLWMFKMGMILYWVHDPSPRRQKTYALVEQASELLAKLIGLAGLPVLKGFAEKAVKVFYEYKTF